MFQNGRLRMSTNTILRNGLMAVLSTAALSLTACVSGQPNGGVYNYESGRGCGNSCVASSRYGSSDTHIATGMPVSHGVAYPVAQPIAIAPSPIYVDCTQMGTCGAPPAPQVYMEPEPVQSYVEAYQGPIDCPTGTTAQADGTCLQSSYSEPTMSYEPSYTSSSAPVDCPSGTNMQSDGTCLQGSTSSYGYQATGTYSTPSYLPIRK